ncbi:MAG TPA: Wzz/FepE/Etk N-terminal domain-containing protein, partial [Verrucomicrobiae bacterium]|nr:Wzz/FepE/Etk N-terminal domain-containing protein [Verrucomicrobiae bacterium]
MNAKQTGPHAPGLTLGDIYFILFRHKWKILALSALGFIAAFALPRMSTKVYQSEAKLLIRYVTETPAPIHPGEGDPGLKSP